METGGDVPTISCEFYGADPDLVVSVSCGLIDQVCAQVDVDAALLAAIEVPMLDVVEALASRGPVSSITVGVDRDRVLVVELEANVAGVASVDELFGENARLVTSFFDTVLDPDTGHLRLRGDLG